MARIKGLAVQSRLDYFARHFGAAGLARVVEALSPEHAELVRGGLLVSDWYPLSLNEDLLACGERLLGKRDGSLCEQIGRASGRKGLSTVHGAFASKVDAREIGPKMVRSTATLWRVHYDQGSFTTIVLDDSSIESVLEGIEVKEPWICHVLTGYVAAHIEVLGGKNVSVTHVHCRSRRARECKWIARWES
jgi:predicted hydrocarbon binding protein